MNQQELPASVQFYDNLATIRDMRIRRFSLRRIWQTLADSGKYTGDYTHFCRLAKKEFGEELEPKKPGLKKPIPATPQTTGPTGPTGGRNPTTKPTNNSEESDDGPLMFLDDISTKKKS